MTPDDLDLIRRRQKARARVMALLQNRTYKIN